VERLSTSRRLAAIAALAVSGAVASTALSPDDATAAARKRAASRTAPKGPQCPVAGSRAVVFAKALNGTSFTTQDGLEIRLAGVMAPDQNGESPSASATDTARQALAAALQSGSLTLAPTEAPDRYGRVVAQVFAAGVWVQGTLLSGGILRTSPDRASAPCARQLLEAEDRARAAQLGHWHDGAFAVRTPEQLRNRVGTFQVVEGEVTTANTNKGRAYINFGADYKTDFTVTIGPDDLKLFRQARFDVKKLAGKHVRVRGWVELYNGPEMEVSTPIAIQVLDEPAPPPVIAKKSADMPVASEKKKRTRKKKT
jgi:endonuclease YncB( thermonuclease family)